MMLNVIYVFCLTIWVALAFHRQDWHALSGILFGATLGIHLHRYTLYRRYLSALAGMTVVHHYHDAGNNCQQLEREAPSTFGNWSNMEKHRWIKRAERDLAAQAERDSKRGAT